MALHGLSEVQYPIWVNALLCVLRGWLFIYDILAYLPFMLFASPKQKLERSARLKAKPLKENDPSSPYRNVDNFDQLVTKRYEECTTLDQIWDRSTMFYGSCPCMGVREILSVDQEKQSNGKIFEKLNQSEYKFQTYGDVGDRVLNIGAGLVNLGHEPRQKLVIFSETRSEWMITALACFRQCFHLVTVYSTLGEDAIAHAINETEGVTIVAAQELVPKVMKILPHCKTLKRLVYIESPLPGTQPLREGDFPSLPQDFRIVSFQDLEQLGSEDESDPEIVPTPEEIAVIMYTSGTTGMPKGVVMTHGNIVAATAGQAAKIPNLGYGDVYIGYLPLAHVLELGAEIACLTHGVCIGYSSALTMTDTSSKIKRGAKGDCSVLKPTLMATVPTIMDRLYKAVVDRVEHSSPLRKALFEFVYELKRSKIEDGYDTPFLNRLVFSHIRELLGGRIRMMLCGGAPLNGETQRFMNICFCCPIGQGYGLTETCGAGTICDIGDLNTGRVGAPLSCCDIVLRDWPEAGYKATNQPLPQGEVLISGANVAKGYLNNPQKTAEDFIKLGNRTWFCTGDIGEFDSDGSLKIIDRKKDLLKLQHGEYISLGKVETALLTSPLLDNVCVYGTSDKSYLIALVVPNRKSLNALAERNNISGSFEEQCKNRDLNKAFLTEMESHAKKNKLEKVEIPQKIHLCTEVWSPDMGLLTEAMKLKRKPLEEHYRKVIDEIYK